ncbi:hypothetical protein ICG10_001045 [Escherichia coli]|nr:hypothetical protein [Escherichia coli]
MFKRSGLFAGCFGKCIRTYPAPAERISSPVLRLVVLFTHTVNLNRSFLTANDCSAAANWFLFLNYASASCKHDSASHTDKKLNHFDDIQRYS